MEIKNNKYQPLIDNIAPVLFSSTKEKALYDGGWFWYSDELAEDISEVYNNSTVENFYKYYEKYKDFNTGEKSYHSIVLRLLMQHPDCPNKLFSRIAKENISDFAMFIDVLKSNIHISEDVLDSFYDFHVKSGSFFNDNVLVDEFKKVGIFNSDKAYYIANKMLTDTRFEDVLRDTCDNMSTGAVYRFSQLYNIIFSIKDPQRLITLSEFDLNEVALSYLLSNPFLPEKQRDTLFDNSTCNISLLSDFTSHMAKSIFNIAIDGYFNCNNAAYRDVCSTEFKQYEAGKHLLTNLFQSNALNIGMRKDLVSRFVNKKDKAFNHFLSSLILKETEQDILILCKDLYKENLDTAYTNHNMSAEQVQEFAKKHINLIKKAKNSKTPNNARASKCWYDRLNIAMANKSLTPEIYSDIIKYGDRTNISSLIRCNTTPAYAIESAIENAPNISFEDLIYGECLSEILTKHPDLDNENFKSAFYFYFDTAIRIKGFSLAGIENTTTGRHTAEFFKNDIHKKTEEFLRNISNDYSLSKDERECVTNLYVNCKKINQYRDVVIEKNSSKNLSDHTLNDIKSSIRSVCDKLEYKDLKTILLNIDSVYNEYKPLANALQDINLKNTKEEYIDL